MSSQTRLNCLRGKAGPDTLDPGAELVVVVGVVEREHGTRVRDLGEAFFGLAADALRGRVGRDEVGVLGLEALRRFMGASYWASVHSGASST